MFHFHKWSDWSITEKGKVVNHIYKEDVVGSYITQERFCNICGKVQMKTQKTTVRTDVLLVPERFGKTPRHDKVE